MNIYTIMESGCAAVAADSQLQADAQVWYGRPLSVFIDQDKDAPAAADETGGEAPSIQFHNWYMRASEEARRVTCGYSLLITVADPAAAVRADAVNQFSGTPRLDAIIRRALDVIREDKLSGLVMSFEYETETIEFFPAMLAGVNVEFSTDLVIGQDPFD